MSIETDLRKDGIKMIAPLDTLSINSIAKFVSEQLSATFPKENFSTEDLFIELSRLPMYIADIPSGIAEASYCYENSSIYFRDGMGLQELEKFAIHEFIHHLQELKDKKGVLVRLGLCDFTEFKAYGVALNEGAVQLMTSKALNTPNEFVKYYDIEFSTTSPNLYPLLCNLVNQMAYVTGEDILFDSVFKSNGHFKNCFIDLCGEKSFYLIQDGLDKLLQLEEKIAKLNYKLENQELSTKASQKIANKIVNYKKQIKDYYFGTQNMILISYFNHLAEKLFSPSDIEDFRAKLYHYQDFIGTTENYSFFNNYYIDMMAKLDEKYDAFMNNTYLVVKKETRLSKILTTLKKLIFRGQEDYFKQ